MKRNTFIAVLSVILMFVNISFVQAQVKGNKNVVTKTFNQTGFDQIIVSGVIDAEFVQGEFAPISIQADENLFDHITVEKVGNALKLSSKNISKATVLKAVVTLPELSKIAISGASGANTRTTFKGKNLIIDISGASDCELDVDYDDIYSSVRGASSLDLSGNCKEYKSKVSGASDLHADNLISKDVYLEVSGASDANVHATDLLIYDVSEASDVDFNHSPSPTKVVMNKKNVKVSFDRGLSSTDTTKVVAGKYKILVTDDDKSVSIKKEKKNSFDHNRTGVELGINGLLNPDFNMSFKGAERYLDLRMEKSINFNLNLWEYGIGFNKKGTFGVVTGVGLSWNNYRFSHPVVLSAENDELEAYYIEGVSVRKSKLTNMYVTVPVLLEFQNHIGKNGNRFYVAAGVIGGLRAVSHTKTYFNESNTEYTLQNANPEGTQDVNTYKTSSKNRNIEKEFDSFYMNPFKLDVCFRTGWSNFGVYCNY